MFDSLFKYFQFKSMHVVLFLANAKCQCSLCSIQANAINFNPHSVRSTQMAWKKRKNLSYFLCSLTCIFYHILSAILFIIIIKFSCTDFIILSIAENDFSRNFRSSLCFLYRSSSLSLSPISLLYFPLWPVCCLFVLSICVYAPHGIWLHSDNAIQWLDVFAVDSYTS